MARQSGFDTMQRYLDDMIAAERSFEGQFCTFAKETEGTPYSQMFTQHAEETRSQHQRLEVRLRALGGSPSGTKGMMARMAAWVGKMTHTGHEEPEKWTQDLIMAHAVEQLEIGMYESLACAAAAAGDTETERLAREIQQEERSMAQKVWNEIPQSARDAYQQVTTGTRTQIAA